MSKDEKALKRILQMAVPDGRRTDAPAFDDAWKRAEERYRLEKHRNRYQRVALAVVGSAAAILAIMVMLFPELQRQTAPDFNLDYQLMVTTSWNAPSDILMPHYSFDVFSELPELPVSTVLHEGSLQ